MAKQKKLFDEEQAPRKKEDTPLPLIPQEKKKASKNDTPLEKEIRRFNRLVKELHEHEEQAKKQKEQEDEYERLYQQWVVPQLAKLAEAKYRFVLQAHHLFEQGRFTKPKQKQFTDLILDLLHDVTEYVPEAGELLRHYLNKQVHLMTKKEKEQFSRLMQQEGLEADLENFDMDAAQEQGREKMREKFFEQQAHFFEAQKNAHLQQKKEAHQQQDINTLYKELARQLHPDLEQNEQLRHEKEHLMKDLSKARQNRDLYAMLLIRSKAQQLAQNGDAAAANQPYTLEQLKRYNKELKRKLDEQRASYMNDFISNLALSMQGYRSTLGPHSNPQQEIEEEVRDIKRAIKDFTRDAKTLQTPDDITAMLEAHKAYKKSMRDFDPFF